MNNPDFVSAGAENYYRRLDQQRYDGKGYPTGLTGEDISPEGRIAAVADVYDGLTSRRSYMDAWSEKDAYDEIRGAQSDPKVVDVFIAAHEKSWKGGINIKIVFSYFPCEHR